MESPEATETTETAPAPEAKDDQPREAPGRPTGNPWLAVALALALPGLGHLYLRRWLRAAVFAAVVLAAVATGILLDGELWSWSTPVAVGAPGMIANPWLQRLLGIVAMGMGGPWFVLQWIGYRGDVVAVGYEYGTTFFFTAALMNLLLVLDAWDVSRGHKP